MTQDSKRTAEVREYWIYPKNPMADNDAHCEADVYRRWAGTGQSIHAIEKSAYDALAKQLAEAQKEIELLRAVLGIARVINNNNPDVRMNHQLKRWDER